jgi:hypothetical protein
MKMQKSGLIHCGFHFFSRNHIYFNYKAIDKNKNC